MPGSRGVGDKGSRPPWKIASYIVSIGNKQLDIVYCRYFLETVMGETLSELIQNCTFGILAETVRAEKERKAQLLETILK